VNASPGNSDGTHYIFVAHDRQGRPGQISSGCNDLAAHGEGQREGVGFYEFHAARAATLRGSRVLSGTRPEHAHELALDGAGRPAIMECLDGPFVREYLDPFEVTRGRALLHDQCVVDDDFRAVDEARLVDAIDDELAIRGR
jgi:hypothetical protein